MTSLNLESLVISFTKTLSYPSSVQLERHFSLCVDSKFSAKSQRTDEMIISYRKNCGHIKIAVIILYLNFN